MIAAIGVVAAEVVFIAGSARAIAIPHECRVGATGTVPAADVTVAVVGKVDLVGLVGSGGTARCHFADIGVPVIAVDDRKRGHAFGAGDNARSGHRAADVGGVVD